MLDFVEPARTGRRRLGWRRQTRLDYPQRSEPSGTLLGHDCYSQKEEFRVDFMKRLLIITVLAASMPPLYAQTQQPDTAKLKAEAQKVVSIIRADKDKTQAYCQLDNIGEQIDQANQAKDTTKADALSQQGEQLEKKLGPEYHTLFDALNDADPDSQDVKDILSMFDTLAESCPH
jgi:hypothetical protein